MTDLSKVQSDRPSIRGRGPWIGLLILSALYWLLTRLGLRVSPAHVPHAIQWTVAFCLPFIGLIGLGKGRWPKPLIIMLAIAVVGSLGLVALSTMVGGSGSGHTNYPATATVEGRTIRLVHEVQPSFSGSCYDLNVELAAGWLWQRLDLTTCLDHEDPGTGEYDPASLAVERGPVPSTVVLSALAPTGNDSPPVRKRIGIYRVDAIGRLIIVAPSSPRP